MKIALLLFICTIFINKSSSQNIYWETTESIKKVVNVKNTTYPFSYLSNYNKEIKDFEKEKYFNSSITLNVDSMGKGKLNMKIAHIEMKYSIFSCFQEDNTLLLYLLSDTFILFRARIFMKSKEVDGFWLEDFTDGTILFLFNQREE